MTKSAVDLSVFSFLSDVYICAYLRTAANFPRLTCCVCFVSYHRFSVHQLVCIHLSHPSTVLLLSLGVISERLRACATINTVAYCFGHPCGTGRSELAHWSDCFTSLDAGRAWCLRSEKPRGTSVRRGLCQLCAVHRLGSRLVCNSCDVGLSVFMCVSQSTSPLDSSDTFTVTGLGLLLSSISKHANHGNNPGNAS